MIVAANWEEKEADLLQEMVVVQHWVIFVVSRTPVLFKKFFF